MTDPVSAAERSSVLIAGGGLAGLSLAVAFKTALGRGFAVHIVDPAIAAPPADQGRASAFAAAARRMFEATGVWDAIAPEAQPILDMVVTDSRTMDVVRPVFLTFAGEIAPGEPFAHMAPNATVTGALWDRARELGVGIIASTVTSFEAEDGLTRVTLANSAVVETPLLVACDGGRSRIREMAGIRTVGWDYGQSGVVCTVSHEYDH